MARSFHNLPVHDNLQALQHTIKEWKFLSFDNVLSTKRELMARIGGIQRKLVTSGTSRWSLNRSMDNHLLESA
jgi:hypothetical protein